VVRWGHFSGRQRYRCRGCVRCFSDLTETSFSYIKKLDRWPDYFVCLSTSETVRSAAAHTGVAVSTAFRWRHRILQSASDLHRVTLSGLVEFAVGSLPYSTKGTRRKALSSWTTGMYFGYTPMLYGPGCIVVVARDRQGGHHAERVDTATLTGGQLRHLFEPVLATDCTLLCNEGRYGKFAFLAQGNAGKRRFIKAPRFGCDEFNPYHTRNAHTWLRRFGWWLKPFRGVATKYVPNYLHWRLVVDTMETGPWFLALAPCGRGPPGPTLPANSM